MANYIPSKQVDLRIWALNFSTLITANPGLYGLLAGDAVTIAAAYAAYDAALTLAIDPSTRTPDTIQAKDDERAAMLPILRIYAQQVRNNAGVNDADKIALGLTVPDRHPTPIPAPTTNPAVIFLNSTPGLATFRYYDVTTPLTKAKPFGAIGLQVAVKSSATPITDPAELLVQKVTGKSPFTLEISPGSLGIKHYIAARWITRRGLVGPWSEITNFIGT